MDTDDIREAISAEETMTVLQEGFLSELADIELSLIKGQSDARYNKEALEKVIRLRKEIERDCFENKFEILLGKACEEYAKKELNTNATNDNV